MSWLDGTEEYVSRTGSGPLKIQFVNVIHLLVYVNQNYQTHSSTLYDVSCFYKLLTVQFCFVHIIL